MNRLFLLPSTLLLLLALAGPTVLADDAAAPAPAPITSPVVVSDQSQTQAGTAQWNTINFKPAAPFAYDKGLVIRGHAKIESDGMLTYLGCGITTQTGKKIFLKYTVAVRDSIDFVLPLREGVITGDSTNKDPIADTDQVVSFTLYARFDAPAPSKFTVDHVEIAPTPATASADAPPTYAPIHSPTRDPLYQGTFTLLPALQGKHPRLLVTPDEMAAAEKHYQQDPAFFASMLPSDKIVNFPPDTFTADDTGSGRIAHVADLACAYRLTRNPVYLQALQKWMPQLTSFQAFDIGSIGAGPDLFASDYLLNLSISYDVLKGVADDALVGAIRTDLIAEATHVYGDLVSLKEFPYEQNHFTKPLCGLGIAGMVLIDEVPAAKDWALYARNVMARADDTISHDGWYFEGMSYWSYTLSTTVMWTQALKNTTGDDWFQKPLFKLAPLYLAHSFLPNPDFFFDFGDAGPRVNRGGTTAQAGYDAPWHTLPLRISPTVPYTIQRNLKSPLLGSFLDWVAPLASKPNTMSGMYLMLWQHAFPAASVPLPATIKEPPYHYFDDEDIVTWRNAWNDPDATAVAFKSGPPAGHYITKLLPLYPEWHPSFGHAHPDAGSFILFAKGAYLVGVTDYTIKKTEYCSSILVDGQGQYKEGTAWVTFNQAPYTKYDKIRMENVWLGHDVAASSAIFQDAYDDAMQLKTMRRDYVLIGGRYLTILDTIHSDVPHEYEWRLQTDKEVANPRADRFVEENGNARLVMQNLAPIGSFQAAPTITETELYGGASRPQQRGFHLAMKSPRTTDYQFLTGYCVQSASEKEPDFTATKVQDHEVRLSDGTTTCTIWLGPGAGLDGTFAYELRNAKGALLSAGLSGKSLKTADLKLSLQSEGQATIRSGSNGGWQTETSNPANHFSIEDNGRAITGITMVEAAR